MSAPRTRLRATCVALGPLALALFGAAFAQESPRHEHHHPEHHHPALHEPVPPLTDADRAAAFPPIRAGHAAHDLGTHVFLGFDQLEALDAGSDTGFGWDITGWMGGDITRAWLRTQGERLDGHTEAADVELLAGRAIAPWWDLVAGVRHDFAPGPSQTFVGVGVIGLAPYKFELEAGAYIGEAGQTTARVEAAYELLLSHRLILEPLVEVDLYGKTDRLRGIGSGLSTIEAGARLRYEVTRRFAPYVGVTYARAYSRTADLRRAGGDDDADTVFAAGVRTWF